MAPAQRQGADVSQQPCRAVRCRSVPAVAVAGRAQGVTRHHEGFIDRRRAASKTSFRSHNQNPSGRAGTPMPAAALVTHVRSPCGTHLLPAALPASPGSHGALPPSGHSCRPRPTCMGGEKGGGTYQAGSGTANGTARSTPTDGSQLFTMHARRLTNQSVVHASPTPQKPHMLGWKGGVPKPGAGGSASRWATTAGMSCAAADTCAGSRLLRKLQQVAGMS